MANHLTSEFDYLFKFLIIGDTAVGKSSLLLRFSDNTFQDNYTSTIGVDFKIRTLEIEGKVVKLQLWDTAGQERFRTITTSYYRGADGVVLVFDVTDATSFNNLKIWLGEIEKFNSKAKTLLVGNKCDLSTKREVNHETAKAFADKMGMRYLETSAKDSMNVEKVFVTLASELKQRAAEQSLQDNKKAPTIGLGQDQQPKAAGGCCSFFS